jgi:hypothetical protein
MIDLSFFVSSISSKFYEKLLGKLPESPLKSFTTYKSSKTLLNMNHLPTAPYKIQ